MQDLNVVALIGRLTRDPELRSTSGGTAVASLRIAVNGSRKDSAGAWQDVPNFFDITVWGTSAENSAKYLAKGHRVGIRGRLAWREWETDSGGKRQAVDVVADQVQFLEPRRDDRDRDRDRSDTSEFEEAHAQAGGRSSHDDEIPFARRPFIGPFTEAIHRPTRERHRGQAQVL